jgi:hypothetical protein
MLRLFWLCLHVLILGRAPKKPCRLESCLCGMAPWRPPAADYCSAGFCDEHCAKRCALDSHYAPCTCSAPPRGHTTRQHDYRRLQVDELRAVLDVVERLAAALKASEERARKAEDEEEELRELVARYQEASGIDVGGDPGGVTPEILSKFVQSEEARANAAEKQCAELAAANLGANKRIVELEHERDAARAELARLTTPLASAELAQIEREHAIVAASFDRDGVSPKDSAEAHRNRGVLLAEIRRLTTPRPIAEAPRKAGSQIIALWMDGDVVESMDVVCWADMDDGDHPERKFWMNTAGDVVEHMTHYLPLPEVKP